jgi:hypothetical protein
MGPNYKLDGDGFYISYNPCPGAIISMFAADDGGDETAIVHAGNYYILNGDFRDKYEELIGQGFDACKAFYDTQNNKSSWSDAS